MKRSIQTMLTVFFIGSSLLPVKPPAAQADTGESTHVLEAGTYKTGADAAKALELLRSLLREDLRGNARVEAGPSGFAVRAVGFEGYMAAQPVYQQVRPFFPKAFIQQTSEPRMAVSPTPGTREVDAVVAPEPMPAPVKKVSEKRIEHSPKESRKNDSKAAVVSGAGQVVAPTVKTAEASPLTPPDAGRPVTAGQQTPSPSPIPAVELPQGIAATKPTPAAVAPDASRPTSEKAHQLHPEQETPSGKGLGHWLGYGLLAALPFAAGYSGRRKRLKKGRAPMLSMEDKRQEHAGSLSEPAARQGLPALSRDWELRVQQNQRELGSAEGNLHHAARDAKTIYVTSCFHGEGKTTAAVSLALALAEQSTRKVLLIDGNTHSPQLHVLFGTEASPGLSDFNENDMDISSLLRETVYPRLTLMTLGDPKELGDAVEKKVRLLNSFGLRERFDYILVDGHSALGSSHVPLIAQYFDGLVLAVECEKTKWEVVQQVREKIEQVGGKVIGVVLNKRKYYIPKLFYGRK